MTGPPIGDPSPERQCSRFLHSADDGTEVVCAKPPVLHILWSHDDHGWQPGWACAEHEAEALRWSSVGHHPVSPDCGMPGATFYEHACRCDTLPTAEPIRASAVAAALSGEATDD